MILKLQNSNLILKTLKTLTTSIARFSLISFISLVCVFLVPSHCLQDLSSLTWATAVKAWNPDH